MTNEDEMENKRFVIGEGQSRLAWLNERASLIVTLI
jgi:hypothetical protein